MQDSQDYNPFSQLDKKQFPSAKNKQAFKPKEKAKALLDDNGQSQEFLQAVDRVKPLATTSKTSSKTLTNPLVNPVLLAPEEMPATTKKQAKKKKSALARDASNPIATGSEKGVKVPELPQLEDESVFFSAMQAVTPLAGKGRAIVPEVETTPLLDQDEPCPLQDFIDGKVEFTLAFTDEYVEGHIIGLDLITVGKLQAGQLSPEAHLDLHGLNAMQAYTALINFFRMAYHKGQRTVLVVCGRGHNSIQKTPVLREKLQNWFTQDPLKRVILAFCTAKSMDGGAGALYVLLRKFRKDRGKIHWERIPVDQDLL